MTVRTSAPGRVVIVGPLSLILTVWACGGSPSSSGLSSGGGSGSGGGSNTFGMGDDASGGSASSSGGISGSGSSSGLSGSSGLRRRKHRRGVHVHRRDPRLLLRHYRGVRAGPQMHCPACARAQRLLHRLKLCACRRPDRLDVRQSDGRGHVHPGHHDPARQRQQRRMRLPVLELQRELDFLRHDRGGRRGQACGGLGLLQRRARTAPRLRHERVSGVAVVDEPGRRQLPADRGSCVRRLVHAAAPTGALRHGHHGRPHMHVGRRAEGRASLRIRSPSSGRGRARRRARATRAPRIRPTRRPTGGTSRPRPTPSRRPSCPAIRAAGASGAGAGAAAAGLRHRVALRGRFGLRTLVPPPDHHPRRRPDARRGLRRRLRRLLRGNGSARLRDPARRRAAAAGRARMASNAGRTAAATPPERRWATAAVS